MQQSTPARDCPGPDPDTRRPRIAPPPLACDCHAHVFGPTERFPYVEGRSFTPPQALAPAYRRMLDVLGVQRSVIVHGSVHGTDNRPSAEAIAELNRLRPDSCRGIAVIDPECTEAGIAQLHEQGFRGARMSTVVKGGPGFGSLERIAARVRPFGWHLVVHVNRSSELVDLAPRLLATGATLVVDHVARVRGDEGITSPGYRCLLSLMDTGRCWVKLSALHRTSSQAWPWRDMQPLVEGVLRANPERVLWGSDWPHPNHYDAMPNDGELLDALAEWIPDAALRARVLVDNPAALYFA
jgi:2-pyrone-4,6-dicarboxylate lactonase